MQGRRIPVEDPTIDPYFMLENPGDYYGPVPGFYDERPAVFFLLPIPSVEPNTYGTYPVLGCVCSPPHVFTEEPDGSLTIRESILTSYGDKRGAVYGSWHGYLTKGEWVHA